MRILSGAQNQTIASFRNRQDADVRPRFLRKFVPPAIFEVVFDRPRYLD